jgi:hypothetical protein
MEALEDLFQGVILLLISHLLQASVRPLTDGLGVVLERLAKEL